MLFVGSQYLLKPLIDVRVTKNLISFIKFLKDVFFSNTPLENCF